MNLVEITQHTQSEETAEDYLRKMGIRQTFTECPYCKGERVGKIRRRCDQLPVSPSRDPRARRATGGRASFQWI